VVEGRQTREQAAQNYASFHDTHEWKFRWMLRVQKLIPRVPPRILAPLIKLMGSKRFVDWSFNHYLRIAPPEFAGSKWAGSADDQNGSGQQQDDAEDALGRERDLVQAEQT
jgi:menaquinone-9 beta-reductase